MHAAGRAAMSTPSRAPTASAATVARATRASTRRVRASPSLRSRAEHRMAPKVSRRSEAVDPFIVMDVMAAAAEKEAAGDTVIHLEVGQPSTPAPKGGLAAAHAGLDAYRIR